MNVFRIGVVLFLAWTHALPTLAVSESVGLRAKREDNLLSALASKLSTVGRVSNGIALVAGLAEKKIPADQLIAELAQFKSATVPEVLDVQHRNLDYVVSDMKGAPGKIVANNGVAEVEKFVAQMSRLRTMAKLTPDFAKLNSSMFFNQMEQFASNSHDVDLFNQVELLVKESLDTIKKIETISGQYNYVQIGGWLDLLRENLQKMNDALGKKSLLLSAATVIDTYKQLLLSNNGLDPMRLTFDMLALHKDAALSVSNGSFADVAKNAEFVYSLAYRQDTIVPNLKAIKQVVLPRPTIMKRQFTAAFSDGLADLQKLPDDIDDPLLIRAIGVDKNLEKLVLGLNPLDKMKELLMSVHEMLKPTTEPSVISSAQLFFRINEMITGLRISSAETLAALKEIEACVFKPMHVTKEVTDAEDMLQKVRTLATLLNSIKPAVMKIKVAPETLSDFESFAKLIELQKNALLEEDVASSLEKFRKNSEMVKKITTSLTELKSTFPHFPSGAELKAMVTDLNTTGRTVVEAAKKSISIQLEGLNCLRNVSDTIKNVAQGIRAVDVIRTMNAEDAPNLKKAIDGVLQTAIPLKKLQSISTSLEMSEVVKEMVEMKNWKEMAQVLGSTATSIRNMDRLRRSESTVAALSKEGGALFNAQLGNVTDVGKKKELMRKWGDYPKFLSKLVDAIKQIESYTAMLTQVKDLRQLGDLVKKAGMVEKVSEQIEEKIEAIGMLIDLSTDNSTKLSLNTVKEQLDSLALIDMSFSSHSASYDKFPSELNALFAFLGTFLTSMNNIGVTDDVPELSTVAIIIIASAVLVSLLFLYGLFRVFMRWRGETVKSWAKISRAMDKLYFVTDRDAVDYHQGVIVALLQHIRHNPWLRTKTVKSDCSTWTRSYDRPREETRVNLRSDWWYNANELTLRNGQVFIGAEAPMDGTRPAGKSDSRPRFWEMVFERKCGIIVNLCQTSEMGAESQEGCAAYFPELHSKETYNDYTVETQDQRVESGVWQRTLSVECGGKQRTVTHISYPDWPPQNAPRSPNVVVKILRIIRESKQPVLVHCLRGDDRTVTFVGIMMAVIDLERSPDKFSISDIVCKLASFRTGPIHGITQTYFLQFAAFQMVCAAHGDDGTKMLRKHSSTFYSSLDKQRQVQKERVAELAEDAEMSALNGESEVDSVVTGT